MAARRPDRAHGLFVDRILKGTNPPADWEDRPRGCATSTSTIRWSRGGRKSCDRLDDVALVIPSQIRTAPASAELSIPGLPSAPPSVAVGQPLSPDAPRSQPF